MSLNSKKYTHALMEFFSLLSQELFNLKLSFPEDQKWKSFFFIVFSKYLNFLEVPGFDVSFPETISLIHQILSIEY